MKTRFWALALTFFMMNSAWAQKAEVVILPIELPGYYNPLDAEALTKTLQSDLKRLAPQANLQASRPADLSSYGYQAGGEQPPSQAVADKICRAYSASHVCWISIRFSPDYQADTGSLAMGGAARMWVYNTNLKRVTIDQPLSLVRAGQVKDVENQKAARAEALRLANGCVSDLANQLAAIARQKDAAPPAAVSQWATPNDSGATTSRNYKAMISATQAYQKAVKSQSLIDITTTQADLTRTWTTLNQQERTAIAKNYPDLERAMTQVPNYNYGGGYWPYRY